MSISVQAMQPGPNIFDAPGEDPGTAIAGALVEIDGAADQYRRSNDMLDAIALLNAIEGLRRFVLVRATLARGLSSPGRNGAAPMGRKLCEALHVMIGDVPALVENCTRQVPYRMERDTRRAIACLFFLGSLDPRFV
jgi:hypothetical protein